MSFFEVHLADLLGELLAVAGRILLLEVLGPAGAVVLGVAVDLTGQEGRTGHVGATKVDLAVDVGTGGLEGVGQHVAQDQLLIEVLRADGEADPAEVGVGEWAVGGCGVATAALAIVVTASGQRQDHQRGCGDGEPPKSSVLSHEQSFRLSFNGG